MSSLNEKDDCSIDATSEEYSISWGLITDASWPDASWDIFYNSRRYSRSFYLFVQKYCKIYLILKQRFPLEYWRTQHSQLVSILSVQQNGMPVFYIYCRNFESKNRMDSS